MKTKTYYIVKSPYHGGYMWEAYTGFLARLGIWAVGVPGTMSFSSNFGSADDCEERLRRVLVNKDIRPSVVRVVEI